jgi:8-oxoguanine deaminase
MPAIRTWLKNPLAVFTANDLDAAGGLVIADGLIEQVLAPGERPAQAASRCSTPASTCCCRA